MKRLMPLRMVMVVTLVCQMSWSAEPTDVQMLEGPAVNNERSSSDTSAPVRLGTDRRWLQEEVAGRTFQMGFGIFVTGLGVAGLAAGVGILIKGNIDSNNLEPHEHPGMGFDALVGLILAGLGVIHLPIGIPLWIAGYRKKELAKDKLNSLAALTFGARGLYRTRTMGLRVQF